MVEKYRVHFLIQIFYSFEHCQLLQRSISTLKKLKSYLRSTTNEVMYLRKYFYKSYVITILDSERSDRTSGFTMVFIFFFILYIKFLSEG